ncbi:hypothetical protein ERC79_02910 [Rhodococcus sp. ABRD24]|uniref:hypothetical protein n=1 Tax=Rhodococcus sp. ABRD24 TaxID=2507582 RepID=UPI00103BFDCF|nr:hypothetical protein [Rhodococcus sp. ABRD24]QBJ95029.1 hypothetical protein ERC79_02910 [Rhodococcus sp. ABRD24]
MKRNAAVAVGGVLLTLGVAGTLMSILVLGSFIGQWAAAATTLSVMVGVAGFLCIGSSDRG